ncbi:hypothetical protein Cgig2_025754 [Carnegiea gigantea]|uniref:Endonuclease/exonuclease/phosphatase domain-containing protein n=1 Tax=Carnegiea gigantea TaxID=171969 RepID=A0A9Q1GP98_9CARY|nr:hypothetical protein Cgig2_025754 [Carnegiea gigantea]
MPPADDFTPVRRRICIEPYYSWTNRVVRSRIDRVLANVYWYDKFNFTQVKYEAHGLSDHTPLLVMFPQSLKAKTKFQYCDIWAKHGSFPSLISAALPRHVTSSSMQQLRNFLAQLRPSLFKLHKTFTDLREQMQLQQTQIALQSNPTDMELYRKEKEMRERYISILSSSILLLQQQCKIKWIKYGDTSSRCSLQKPNRGS